MEIYFFKIYSKSTADTSRGIINPKLTHSHVNKGSSMLDLHPHSWRKRFQNLSQTHCRYRQGYNQAKSQVIVKRARGPTCWILTHIHEKKNFKILPKPTADTGRDISKPNLTHSQFNKGSSMLDPHPKWWKTKFQNLSQTHCRYRQGYKQAKSQSLSSDKGDQHAGSSSTFMKNIYFKMSLNPIAGTGKDISKPNLSHCKWQRGPACWILTYIHEKNIFQNESQLHCRYR
jgi:hypothetical protein